MTRLTDVYVIDESTEPPDWDDAEVLADRLQRKFDLYRLGNHIYFNDMVIFIVDHIRGSIWRRPHRLNSGWVELETSDILKILRGHEDLENITSRWWKNDAESI